MRSITLTALLLLLTFSTNILTAQKPAPTGEPPILDRALFFDDPEISGGQLSPDGKFISFIKPFKGTRNVWVKRVEESFDDARPVTNDSKRPIPGYFWSRDGKKILFVQDKGGNENFHVYAVNPYEKASKGKVPEAKAITSGDKVRAMIYAVPKSMPDYIYVGLNDRDPAWHDLYKINLSTGKKELIKENTQRITGWTFDLEDKLRLATRTSEMGANEILKVTPDGFEKLYECSLLENCQPLKYMKDGKRFYLVTNKGYKLDKSILATLKESTKALDAIEADPNGKVDFGSAIFSKITDELVGTRYTAAKSDFYWKSKKYEQAMTFLQKEFDGMEVRFQSISDDEKFALINVFSDTDPGAVYLFDWENRKLTLQYRPRPNLPTEHMASMKPITYKSKDGLEIPAYLTLPKGKEAKNLPLVINPHGGPWARDYWGYNPYAQFLANRGYAVLNVNFRSSTGFGKAFLNAGNKKWGEEMQDDLTAGAEYLISEGIVDKSKVAIFGGSYGGYATLAGLTFTPDVYACGVSVVGPSNLITLLESIPPYWKSIEKMFHERMGDPENPLGKQKLKKQSPLFSAHKIKAPLMVVQGANDPRVKQAESDQIVIACRELGLPVEYIVAPDEGHGFRRPVNNMAFVSAMERFFAKHLGGRFQEEMPKDIAKRLKEITVDPATVKLPETMEATSLFDAPPTPVKTLTPSKNDYKISLNIQGNDVEMDMTTTIEEEDGQWKVTDKLISPMGEMVEVTHLDKTTLQPIKKVTKQGLMTIKLNYFDKKIEGSATMGLTEDEVKADIQGAMFAEGSGSKNVLSCLPLEVGYTTSFRNFEYQTKAVKVMKLEVLAKETVTVPAGTFETFKMELKPANGDSGSVTIWVSTDSERLPVKTSAVVAAMGGAVMVSELQKS